VAEIAKSVVFSTGRGIVVVISGDKRVDSAKLSRLIRGELTFATATQVKQITGYPAGGVPPFPHYDGIRVLPDSSLGRFREVWAAAGLPNSVMKLATNDIIATLGAGLVDVAEG
jgi:prolyl-tRNA editing enzyme YbaK/EbsC (Cys-tRNA(Pro) deacylase)